MEKMKKLTAASPCGSCTRVKDPENCENKHCGDWRKWFLARWALLRGYPRRMMDSMQAQVPPGEDPCSHCSSPGELCRTPCRMRQAWEKDTGGQER